MTDRPIHPVGVIAGEQNYPEPEEIAGALNDMSHYVWFIDATEEAMKLGNPILGNVIMIGAACGLGILSVGRKAFAAVLYGCPQEGLPPAFRFQHPEDPNRIVSPCFSCKISLDKQKQPPTLRPLESNVLSINFAEYRKKPIVSR